MTVESPERTEDDSSEVVPVDPAPPASAKEPVVPPAAEVEKKPFIVTLRGWLRDYFLGEDPTLGIAIVPFCFLSMLLFTRHPTKTNFIFDEQEALLANPYVRSIADAQPKFRWVDAFYRDFWGLGPDRSIGSYRPIPDLVWRALWGLGAREQTPFLHHWVNVLLHGVNGALVCMIAFHFTKKRSTAWLAGACFTASAVLTEAVSGVVGIADVLGGTGALLAIYAIFARMPFMVLGVFFATLFGLYSKETALVCVPLVPVTVLLTAQLTHPEKPRRWLRAALAFVVAAGAFVLYVEARRRMFPAPMPPELSAEANADKPLAARTFAAILRWYAQPTLPKDPLNNPLVNAHGLPRVSGALRVYFRGLEQVVFPWTLSGDYSAPQEPVPTNAFAIENVLGGLAMLLPFPIATWFGFSAWRRWRTKPAVEKQDYSTNEFGEVVIHQAAPSRGVDTRLDLRPVIGACLLWIAVSYFPVSNIPVLLPTIRAERFWYFPVIGSSIALAITFDALLARFRTGPVRYVVIGGVVAFFLFQGFAARRHANDYADDLAFWDATRKAVPRSAKAHLNYSVMKGARGDLNERLAANQVALELAPQWPMASIYLGDTLCRLHRAPEAWPHYVHGFELAPNDVNLIALALQCLWDEKQLGAETGERKELDTLKDKYPGTWLEYLGRDILEHGEEHNGVDPKYRPRGYNEGPKE
ncbi:TPR repeat protein [Labilithrix luteola]|uniref:TPR repeat protein n=1 Tax=Labilithrix luteola TaxID=1391654 RepID=A0A0K1PSG9_9BACT|nr:tetratricopeptide repeat protein [Labilithrix luteola]AKU96306.1 TPR repeat protein [Labilithrix luteola]